MDFRCSAFVSISDFESNDFLDIFLLSIKYRSRNDRNIFLILATNKSVKLHICITAISRFAYFMYLMMPKCFAQKMKLGLNTLCVCHYPLLMNKSGCLADLVNNCVVSSSIKPEPTHVTQHLKLLPYFIFDV